jgi:hypothetical protein
MIKKKVTKKRAAKKKTARRQTKLKGQRSMHDEQMYDYGEPKVVRKITSKTVMGADFLDSKPTQELLLYTLNGVIRSYEAGTSDFGQYLKFRGDFKAYNHITETVVRAPACIIPAPMDEILAGQYQTAKAHLIDEETGEIKGGKMPKFNFSIDIGYMPADTPTGYEWTVATRQKIQESDDMLALERSLMGIEHQEEEADEPAAA